MTNQDHDQKKRECFVQFCKDNGIDQEVNISIFDAFDQIFDRAYALGKQFGNSEQVDAEGEEILTVSRKRVQEMYTQNQSEINRENVSSSDKDCYETVNEVLKTLFGSKCLPDNVESSEPNVESLPQNPTENCDNKSHISTDCDKPAEPKENILQPFCQVLESAASTEPTDFGREVNFPTKKQSRNLSQEIENCDKQFDDILKGSFLKERRLNVATRVLCGMMADPISSNIQGKPTPVIVEWAYEIADALIAKVEKGAER